MMKRLAPIADSPRIYFFLSLLPLLFALGVWTLLRTTGSKLEPTPATDVVPAASDSAVGGEPGDGPGDAFGLVPGPATPWAVPGGPGETPTIESPATAMPTPTPMTIPLLGPPIGSFFRLEDTISFYWSAVAELNPGQRYSVYLVDGGERVRLGSAGWPNLGQGYQLQVKIGDFVDGPGDYGWLVVLEDVGSDATLGQSEARPITLVK